MYTKMQAMSVVWKRNKKHDFCCDVVTPLTIAAVSVIMCFLFLLVFGGLPKGHHRMIVARSAKARSLGLTHLREMDGTPEYLRNLSRAKGNPDVVFFNMVPNCGGKTMGSVISKLSKTNSFEYLRLNRVIQTSPHMGESSIQTLVTNMTQFMKNKPILYQEHLHFIDFAELKQRPPTYISVIREPLDYFVSSYNYHRKQCIEDRAKNHSCSAKNRQAYSESVESCVSKNRWFCKTSTIDGYSAVIPFFCGHALGCLSAGTWALNRAKQNIDKYYTVIGLAEEIDRTFQIVERLLPRFFANASSASEPRGGGGEVTGKDDSKSALSKKSRDVMKDRLHLEYDLYYFIKHRFRQQYNAVVKPLSK